MRFEPPLQQGRFVKRYRRFFMDFVGEDGETYTAHCPNTGSLLGCLVEGARVWVQPASNPKRKLRYTWKAIEIGNTLVGVDTSIANGLVGEAIESGGIPELAGYERMLPEVRYGREGSSRIDWLLSRGGERVPGTRRPEYENDQRVYVEVKNTTLALPWTAPFSGPKRTASKLDAGPMDAALSQAPDTSPSWAAFPDAVTERGLKHLRELRDVVDKGHRAAMVFSVQRGDCQAFTPAAHIDVAYSRELLAAAESGVEIYVRATRLTPEAVTLDQPLRLELGPVRDFLSSL